MVSWSRLACLLWLLGCAPVEGTVLVLRDAGVDSGLDREPDAATELDAAMELDAPDAALTADAAIVGQCRIGSSQDGFGDSFEADALDPTHWLVAHGTTSFAGKVSAGGFVRENVAVAGGALLLRVRGDLYTGPIRGIDAAGQPLASGRRSAAAIATRDLFQSGTYQMQGVLSAPPGVEVAMWVMRDDDRQGAIDIATPGLEADIASRTRVRLRSRDALASALLQLPLAAPFDVTSTNSLRFDWYTTATPGVVYWVDDEARWQTDEHLPAGGAARLWIVAWAPDDVPLDFETAEVRIESMFIRPFANSGDRCDPAELVGKGLVAP
jgi:hypothetical protein